MSKYRLLGNLNSNNILSCFMVELMTTNISKSKYTKLGIFQVGTISSIL